MYEIEELESGRCKVQTLEGEQQFENRTAANLFILDQKSARPVIAPEVQPDPDPDQDEPSGFKP